MSVARWVSEPTAAGGGVKGGERSAAVGGRRSRSVGKENTGHRKPGCRTDKAKPPGQAFIESCLRNHNRYRK